MTTLQARPMPIPPNLPWWRYGHVWMVIGGPLVVVVASITTYFIAVRSADGLVDKDSSIQVVPELASPQKVNPAMLPSLVRRNHLVTPK